MSFANTSEDKGINMPGLRRLLLIVLFWALITMPSVSQAAANKIYFTTYDDWKVMRVDIDGSNLETLYTSATGSPCGITIDLITNKFYFTDYHRANRKFNE
jgi:hypothetical protein